MAKNNKKANTFEIESNGVNEKDKLTNKDDSIIKYDDLIDKIKSAQQEICILGVTAFDFNWDELFDSLYEKFTTSDFTMKIIRESENLIAQYSLVTGNQIEDGVTASRGNMNNIRNNVNKFKQKMLQKIEQCKLQLNLEPVEDFKKKDLKTLDAKTEREYILEAIKEIDCLHHFRDKLKSKIVNDYLLPTFNKKFSETIVGKLAVSTFINEISVISQGFNVFANENAVKLASNIVGINNEDELLEDDVLKNTNINDLENQSLIYTYSSEIKENSIELKIDIDFKKINEIIQDELFKYEVDSSTLEFYKGKIKDDDYEKRISEKNYKLKVQRQLVEQRKVYVREEKLKEFNNNSKEKQRLFIKDCYVPLPIPMIKIDKELYITQALTRFTHIDRFQFVGLLDVDNKDKGYESKWIEEFRKYYNKYFGDDSNSNDQNNVQKYMTEETEKGDRKEVIDIFNEKRVRIGSGPRDAFLSNLNIVKSVVWALLFTRDGRMLIHQRSLNAKDNRGLWDKSVGGHVSVEDLDTVEAVKREIGEELFTIENEGQGGHGQEQWTVTNKNKIIYLGDWKTTRFPDLNQLALKSDEYYTFSLNYENIQEKDMRKEIVITERVLPDGEIKKAKCFVDAYLSIVAADFDTKKLYNSQFALLTPNELKNCVLHGKAYFEVENGVRKYNRQRGKVCDFNVTSDLKYLVNSDIWDDVVTEFSRRIEETFRK